MTNQIGGRCEQDICQLCRHRLTDFLPIIHWNRSDSGDHTNNFEIEDNPDLEYKPLVTEYCFHVICLVNLVLFDNVINKLGFNNTGNITMPLYSGFGWDFDHDHHHNVSISGKFLYNPLSLFSKKWLKCLSNVDVNFYQNRTITVDEKREIINIGIQTGLVKSNPNNPNLVASVSKFGYWFDINTLQPIIEPTHVNMYAMIEDLVSPFASRIKNLAKDNLNANQVLRDLKHNIDNPEYNRLYRMLANQNIYRGRRAVIDRSIIDLIQITDENLPIVRKTVSTLRKMNTGYKLNKVMFYLTADQLINTDHDPESVQIENRFREVGGFDEDHYTLKFASLFQPNHPYIDYFKKSLNFLIHEFPDVLNLNQQITNPSSGQDISINDLVYQPFVRAQSGFFEPQPQSGGKKRKNNHQHYQKGGKCRDGEHGGFDLCSICQQPIGGSETILPHDPQYQPHIVHLLSNPTPPRTRDIHYDTNPGSIIDQTEDCFHLECLINMIQTNMTQPVPAQPRHPLHQYEFSQDIVQRILNWGVANNLIQQIRPNEYTALVGSDGNNFIYPIVNHEQQWEQNWDSESDLSESDLDQHQHQEIVGNPFGHQNMNTNPLFHQIDNLFISLINQIHQKKRQFNQFERDQLDSQMAYISELCNNFGNNILNREFVNHISGKHLLTDDYNLLDILPHSGNNIQVYRDLIRYYDQYHPNYVNRLIFYTSIDDVLTNNRQYDTLVERVNNPAEFQNLLNNGFESSLLHDIRNLINFNANNNNLRLFQRYTELVEPVNQIANANPDALIDVRRLLPNCMNDQDGMIRAYYQKISQNQ